MIGEKVSDMIKSTWGNLKETESQSSFKKSGTGKKIEEKKIDQM